ncbi:MAG: hypothetical protein LUH07_09285 [Lachnospiraceae bacterium]|nr:hypothetical protein [Lachnospiraceae bacterium]
MNNTRRRPVRQSERNQRQAEREHQLERKHRQRERERQVRRMRFYAVISGIVLVAVAVGVHLFLRNIINDREETMEVLLT